MSLGLVSYDDSDESENEVDSDHTNESETKKTVKETVSLHKNAFAKEDSVEDGTVSSSVNEVDKSEYLHLPQSKLSLLNTDIDIKSLITSNNKSGPVKISIPSLNEVEEESEEPSKKKIKPSQKGSGLFALLPTPKSSLVPQSVVNRKSLASKKPNITKPFTHQKPLLNKKPTLNTSLISYEDSGDEEESSGSVDFFSLESKDDNITPAPVDIDLTEEGPSVHNRMQKADSSSEVLSFSTGLESAKWAESSSYSYPQQPISEYPTSEFMTCSSSNLQLDQEAMQQLCGRRDRLKMSEVNLIDVSGDSMLADSQDWLTKQLTEETVHRPSTRRTKDQPRSRSGNIKSPTLHTRPRKTNWS